MKKTIFVIVFISPLYAAKDSLRVYPAQATLASERRNNRTLLLFAAVFADMGLLQESFDAAVLVENSQDPIARAQAQFILGRIEEIRRMRRG